MRTDLGICVVLVVIVAAVFWPVHRYGFANYDDAGYVYENPHVREGVTREGIVHAFMGATGGNWHPLTCLSHMVDCRWFGLEAGWHHLVNLMLHLANTVLLFLALRCMTAARWPSAVTAALFALHPLHVESVVWISERKDVLSGLFFMVTLLAYTYYVRRPGIGRYLLVCLALALGLMAKPMLVTVPFVLLLLDYWPLGRLTWPSDRPGIATGTPADKEGARVRPQPNQAQRRSPPSSAGASRSRHSGGRDNVVPNRQSNSGNEVGNAAAPTARRLVWEKIPLLALSAASCVITYVAQQQAGATTLLADEASFSSRVANALVAYVAYLVNTIYPCRLTVFYPYVAQRQLWQVVGAAIILIAVTAIVLRHVRRRPYLAVGWLWYLGMLVPVIGLVQVGYQSMADRYTYLPLIGVFVSGVWGIAGLAGRLRHGEKGLAAVAAGAMLACVVFSNRQLTCWSDNELLWRHALAVTDDNFLAFRTLGDLLSSRGKNDEAIELFRQSLACRPDFAPAYDGLGLALERLGRRDEAMASFHEALRCDARNVAARYRLGAALILAKRYDEASICLREALRLQPDLALAHDSMGVLLYETGKPAEAAVELQEALRLDPHSAPTMEHLGMALVALARPREAVELLIEAVRRSPQSKSARGNLAVAREALGMELLRQQRSEEAVEEFREAARLLPAYARVRWQLGVALEQLGRLDEAIPQYVEAIRLDPTQAFAFDRVARLWATHPDAKFRNPAEAVRFAERACELSGRSHPGYLDTLAAAHANAGRFAEAAALARGAADLARRAGQNELAEQIQRRAALYDVGQAYRGP